MKPLMIFAAGRSGSSIFYEILRSYLHQTRGTLGLGEFFNQVTPEEAQRRLDELMPNPEKYFFKLMTGQIYGKEQFSLLSKNYDWIFVERRNLFEQYLSLLVSIESNIYYRPDGIILPERSLTGEVRHREVAFNRLWRYQFLKKLMKPERILFYEDFLSTPRAESVLERLFLPLGNFDPTLVHLPEKQNKGSKLLLFASPAEIVESYKNSFLNKISRYESTPMTLSAP